MHSSKNCMKLKLLLGFLLIAICAFIAFNYSGVSLLSEVSTDKNEIQDEVQFNDYNIEDKNTHTENTRANDTHAIIAETRQNPLNTPYSVGPEPIFVNKPEQEENDDYTLYLANAHKMILLFITNKNCSVELQIFNSMQHPKNIQEIVSLLNLYNDLLKTHKEEKVELFDSKLLTQFIHVTKLPNVNQQDLYDLIKNKLNVLTKYIFSTELRKHFIAR